MLDAGKKHGVPVAALVGTKQHAIRQVEAGVDILVVSGGEAGGHCGDVSTLVLVPEVYEAIQPYRDVPILAAGGIVTGRQMAACMAMGARARGRARCGSPPTRPRPIRVVKEKMLAASSRDTVRSRARTGKHSRQLRSPWTDAWESPDAPTPLPMPLQSMRERAGAPQGRQARRGRPPGREGARDVLGRAGRRAHEPEQVGARGRAGSSRRIS